MPLGQNWIKDLTDRKTIQCEKSTSKEKENLIKIPKKNLLRQKDFRNCLRLRSPFEIDFSLLS